MSEVSAEPVAAASPAPQAPGLLGGAGTTQPQPAQPQAPAAVATEPVAPVIPEQVQAPVGQETPYFSLLIQNNPELKGIEKQLARFTETDPAKFAATVAKSWSEATKFKGINIPGAEATPEDIAQYRKVNGIPAEAKDYQFSEGMQAKFKDLGITDPALVSKYAEAAHKANITPAQFEALAETQAALVQELSNQQSGAGQKALEANVEALKGEWADRFDVNLGDAQKLHEVAYAGAKLSEAEQRDLDAFAKTTAYAKMLHSLGQRIPKESSIHHGPVGVFQGDASRLEAIKVAMAKDPKHPLMDPSHPDHQRQMTEFSDLAARVKAG